MRHTTTIAILAISLPLFASGFSADRRMPSRLGDARLGGERSMFETNLVLRVKLPPGEYTGITVTGWLRLRDLTNSYLTTQVFWSPEGVRYSNPDLLAGAGGYPASGNWDGAPGTNLTDVGGSITASSFPWTPYSDTTSSNLWRRGIYTIAGWSSNVVSVSLGGSSVDLGPGVFNRNAIPGVSNAVIISGSGPVCVGISQTPDLQFFQQIGGTLTNLTFFTLNSIITNEIVFISWSLSLNASSHLVRTTMYSENSTSLLINNTTSNAMPRSARALSSDGVYLIGIIGVIREKLGYELELFDMRTHLQWLSDDELKCVYNNGLEEISRRRIPRWK